MVRHLTRGALITVVALFGFPLAPSASASVDPPPANHSDWAIAFWSSEEGRGLSIQYLVGVRRVTTVEGEVMALDGILGKFQCHKNRCKAERVYKLNRKNTRFSMAPDASKARLQVRAAATKHGVSWRAGTEVSLDGYPHYCNLIRLGAHARVYRWGTARGGLFGHSMKAERSIAVLARGVTAHPCR